MPRRRPNESQEKGQGDRVARVSWVGLDTVVRETQAGDVLGISRTAYFMLDHSTTGLAALFAQSHVVYPDQEGRVKARTAILQEL